MTYFLFSGNTDWTKAWLTSPVLGMHRSWTAKATRSLSLRAERMGAKQSLLFHLWGSKFPRTTIQYFAHDGVPFSSVLTLDIAIDGRAVPTIGRSAWYSSSVIYSQVSVSSWRPMYSSRYDLSQISLSLGLSLACSWSLGSCGDDKPFAETLREKPMILGGSGLSSFAWTLSSVR